MQQSCLPVLVIDCQPIRNVLSKRMEANFRVLEVIINGFTHKNAFIKINLCFINSFIIVIHQNSCEVLRH